MREMRSAGSDSRGAEPSLFREENFPVSEMRRAEILENAPAIPQPAPLPDVESREETLSAQLRLWAFMKDYVNQYTMGQSSSVPMETAQSLFDGVLYTLGLDAEDPELLRKLPAGDLESAYRKGVERLSFRTKLGERYWRSLASAEIPLQSRALSDTLHSIGEGWHRYDVRRFAQEFPCSIDYQLCLPVSEQLRGVDYVNEYLRRLGLEYALLRRLDASRCKRVLESVDRNYPASVCSLYEPVAAAAVGLALSGGAVEKLNLAPGDYARIRTVLGSLPASGIEKALAHGASRVSDFMGLQGACRRYLEETAVSLAPRAQAALETGELRCVFPPAVE